jgi:signal transduction histidine kinase
MKSKLRLGVRGKFVLLTAGILTIVFSAIAIYLARANTSTLRAGLYDEAKAFATLATPQIGGVYTIYKDSGSLNIDREVDNFSALDKSITNITIVDLSGSVVYSQHRDIKNAVSREQAENFEPNYINDDKGVLQSIIYPYKEDNGIRRYSIVYNISSTSIDSAVRSAALSVFIFSLIGLILTTLLIYLFVNYWLIRKLRRISSQSTLISEGQLDQTIEVTSNDELGDLAKSVNNMANSLKADIEKLKELDKAKSEFMMITSHNIRSPLTIINGFIDTAEIFNTVDQLRNALEKIKAGSKRLSVFAEDVLTISKLEMGERIQSLESVDVTEFLSTISKDFVQLADLKQVKFSDDLPPISKRIHINRPYMRAAIWNLLDNALKFTPKDGHIVLMAGDKGNSVEISISDTGIGIAPEEITKLFTKFHRGTDTLTYDYEGTGIGLYATKMIVDRLNGQVHAQSKLGAGSTFTITLPYIALPDGLGRDMSDSYSGIKA